MDGATVHWSQPRGELRGAGHNTDTWEGGGESPGFSPQRKSVTGGLDQSSMVKDNGGNLVLAGAVL
jgi:hypothetical protein